MASPRETPHASVTQLLTGHYRQTGGYSAYPARGVEDWLLILTVSGLGRFGYESGEMIARPIGCC